MMPPCSIAALATLLLSLAVPLAAQHRIRMATGDAPYAEAFEVIAAEYEKLHPDVDVTIQVIPSESYATWIRTAVAGGEQTSPDLFNPNYAPSFFPAGKSIALTPYLDSVNPYTGKLWRDSFHTQHLQMVRSVLDYPAVPLNYIEIGMVYNKELFAKAGIERPPGNWIELLAACEKLRAIGAIPIAVAADAESTWAMSFGWLVRIMSDAYNYDRLDYIRARPGDFAYVVGVDDVYVPDKTNPTADVLVNIPMERYLQAFLDGDMAVDTPAMASMYTRIRDFSRYWQRGSAGSSFTSCYQLFLTGRTGMMMHHSGAVLGMQYDIDQLEPDDQFEWGVFPIPSPDDDPYAQIPLRGVGAPIPTYGVIRKDRAQNDRVVDFLMYLTTPQSGRRILEAMVEKKRAIVGPFAIRDVPLPPELDEKFRPFLGRGTDRLSVRGLYDEQQATWRWTILTQEYMGGALALDDYLAQYQVVTIQAIPRLIRANDLDMDPTTRDNNGPLITEIEGVVARLGDNAEAQSSVEALRAAIEVEIRSLGFRVDVQPAADIDLLIDRTVPIAIARDGAAFADLEQRARAIAEANRRQFLCVVERGSKPLRARTFNFRPTSDEVIARLAGRRYTNAELRKILVD